MLMQLFLLWLPCAGTADVRLADPLSSGGGGATLAQQRLRAAAALDAACGDWAAVAARLQDTAAAADAPHWATGGYGWAQLQQGSVEVGTRKDAADGKTFVGGGGGVLCSTSECGSAEIFIRAFTLLHASYI